MLSANQLGHDKNAIFNVFWFDTESNPEQSERTPKPLLYGVSILVPNPERHPPGYNTGPST